MIGIDHIQLNSTRRQSVAHTSKPTIGSAHVLQQLLPQLWVSAPSERYKAITGLDYYMREETQGVLARIETHCEMLLDSTSSAVNHRQQAEFSVKVTNGKCELAGQFPAGLDKKLNQDSWLMDAFAWLSPNYLALVHSLELSAFSYAYQRSHTKAAATYQHFDQENNGLKIVVKVNAGKGQWLVISPLNSYHL